MPRRCGNFTSALPDYVDHQACAGGDREVLAFTSSGRRGKADIPASGFHPMHQSFAPRGALPPVPVWFVTADTFAAVREKLAASALKFIEATGFEPTAGRHLLVPDTDGSL